MARSRRQKEVASVDAYRKEDVDLVVTLLEEKPNIDILWGGSNMATDISIKAVERLGRQDSVAVFWILDLSAYTAKKLLDSESPLQSVIDQAGALIGEQATKRASAILCRDPSDCGDIPNYEFIPVDYRLFTQDDREAISKLLDEAQRIEGP
ncbi:MAG: hypothetical protein AB4040_07185 [Synechococcus sp.]